MPPAHLPLAEAFDSWDRVFSGRAALEATGASAGDMEARLLCEEQLAAEAAQVGSEFHQLLK